MDSKALPKRTSDREARVRRYCEDDAVAVGRLIARTYRMFNLSEADPDEQMRLLGPFRYAESDDPRHQKTIRDVIQSPMLYVAEVDGRIRGVLRGRPHVLASLFVDGEMHRVGIGRKLVERFERDSRSADIRWIRVASTVFAVPFYQAMGYKRTTGLRRLKSFEGSSLLYQPMKKTL
jgi:GNAT superfamily N-acetyltransferase